jgi:tetratricopeptide (TPR) repeat protein
MTDPTHISPIETARAMGRDPLVRVGAVLLVLVFFGSVALLNATKLGDTDIWWHVAVGERMVETRSLAATDDFDHPHVGLRYENECWLFDLASYGLWKVAPNGIGLIAARIALYLAIYGVLLAALGRRGLPLPMSVQFLILSVMLIVQRFYIRNFTVGYLLFVLYLYWLLGPRDHPRRRRLLWLMPALMALWANTHVGCVFGLIALGLYLVAQIIDAKRGVGDWKEVRFAALLFALTAIASGISPYPFEWVRRLTLNLLVYPTSQAMEEIPPPWSRFQLFYLSGIVGGIFLIWRFRALSTFHKLIYVFLFAAASRHNRFIGEYGLVVPLVFGEAFMSLPETASAWRSLSTRRFVLGLQAFLIALLAYRVDHLTATTLDLGTGPNCRTMPCRSIEFIKENGLTGHFYNTLGYGGFFVWNLYPEHRAFWDGRFKAQIGLFEEFRDRPIADVLERHGVRFALVPFPEVQKGRADMGLIAVERWFLARPDVWKLIHFDDVAMIFARDDPENTAVVARLGYRVLRPWRLDFGYLDLTDPAIRDALAADIARAVRDSPDAPVPLYLAAKLAEATGDVDRAARTFADGTDRFPRDALFYNGLGLVRTRERDFDEAVGLFRKALDLGPGDARTLNNLGVAYLQMGDLPAAAWRFRDALRADSRLPEPYFNLAAVLRALGNPDKAFEYDALYEKIQASPTTSGASPS